MAYLAIYRKYRPATFEEVIGQDHIVGALTNQVSNGRISHAYLFCGSRGTGKTSTARIFAKAINCQNPANGSPCGKCPSCQIIDSGSIDLVEIDAASNNRVDEVRDLREKAKYPPVNLKYKVYIIDEVHMLTEGAFNALLKTLEEPPAHVVFILATTESHKLPATILSRCQRFDFHLVAEPLLAELIAKIYKDIGKDYEDEAVSVIARAGEGSVRDALSIADTCASLSSGKLTCADVLNAVGASDFDKIHGLASALLAGDAGEIFERINGLALTGKGMNVLAKDLVQYFRNLLVVGTVKNPNAFLALPSQNIEELKKQAEGVEPSRLSSLMEIFASIDADLRYSLQPRLVLEAAALRAAGAIGADSATLAERLRRLERQVEELLKKD